jgi:hypothetical protein
MMFKEHGYWGLVVKATRGVTITREDWESSPDAANTPGQRAIKAIRAWGDALADLRVSQARDRISESREKAS